VRGTVGRSEDSLRDRRGGIIQRVWQNLVPLIAIGVAFYAVLGVESKQTRVNEGRAVSVDVICGYSNGLATAVGGAFRSPFLGSQTAQQRRYQRNLEKLGGPSYKERRLAAEKAARVFAAELSRSVAAEAGVVIAEVVRDDGTLDCDAMRRVTGTVPPSTQNPRSPDG
jgi:hypothetical protein